MRIIAGEFRGRKLLSPASDVTRPITDRVKQSLFDILMPMMEGAIVYDCFCGTGSMGLECLSRGAAKATFFDADRSALGLLRTNIETLKVKDRAVVVAGDIFKWAAHSPHPNPPPEYQGRGNKDPEVTLLFLDPPYRLLNEKPVELQTLAANLAKHLAPDGMVIFRHDAADSLSLPTLVQYDQRQYGEMILEFLSLPQRPAPSGGIES